MSAYRLTTNLKGFTLVELLVVIAIIAILSVVGIAAFKGVTGGARDSTRRADIDAIAKAYEIQKTSGYIALSDSQFASGKKPQDPNSQKGDYFNWLATDGSGFKVCASLDDNPNNVCNTPATNCYCKFSSQGTIASGSTADSSSTQATFGLGGSSSSSCDSNGTLLSGLVGYWKMDENIGVTTIADSSGNGNSGTLLNGASIITPSHTQPFPTDLPSSFVNAGSFDGSNDYATTPITSYSVTAATQVAWVKIAAGGLGRIISKGGGRFSTTIIGIVPQISYELGTTGGEGGSVISGNLSLNTWYLVVMTYDGSVQKAYLNGALIGQNNKTGAIQDVGDNITFGADSGGGYPANAIIDDVRIYNRALSGLEISTLYNNGNGCIY